ncbi:MAG TPA: hypothetical protein QGH10_14730 [Armatimonadota bacterium]|nr:hypothetical protein [Armatimonadota bacterium]
MSDNKLYLIGQYDCEPLAAKSPQCGGPQTWQESEQKVLEVAGIYRERGLLGALGFHLTPEAAKAQSDLYKGLHAEGIFMGLQINVPGFRYPTYDRDLGLHSPDEQREIIRLGLEDFEEALGFSTTCYTACCGSRSHATASILVEQGFKVFRPPGAGRLAWDRPDKTTVGMFPYPYKASSEHMCLAGDLDLLCIPVGNDVTGKYKRSEWAPGDLRGENPVSDETREMYRYIVDSTIDLGRLLDVPLQNVQAVGHNTDRCEGENVAYVLDYIREAADKKGLELVPISPVGLRGEAERIGLV